MKNGHTTRQKAPAGRYALLDELRGLDLVSMMLYHACWDIIPCAGAHRCLGQGRLSRQSRCFLCRRTGSFLVC